MSYRMAKLAARFASGIGGGGTTTSEGKIPDELKPLIGGSVDRMLGLQDYFWGGGGGSGGGAYSPNYQGGNATGGWGYNGNSLNQNPPPPTSGSQPKGGGPPGSMITPGTNMTYDETPWSMAMPQTTRATTKTGSPNDKLLVREGDEPPGGGGGGGGDYPWTDKVPTGGGSTPIPDGGGAGGGGSTGGGGYGLDIAGRHPREVAGASDLQKWAGNRVTDLYNKTDGEFRAADSYRRATNTAGQQVTGETIDNDPAIAAAVQSFQKFQQPLIQDRASLQGNARGSSVLNDLDMGLASMMLPQIQAAQQREENRINRMTGTALETGKGWQSLGAQDWQRRKGAMDTGMQYGGEMRSQAQERMNAEHEDFLRRAALGENALMGPFGGLVPSTIGSTTRSKK